MRQFFRAHYARILNVTTLVALVSVLLADGHTRVSYIADSFLIACLMLLMGLAWSNLNVQ